MGTTTAGSSSRSGTCHLPSSSRRIIHSTILRRSPPDSTQTVSGKPGAVHYRGWSERRLDGERWGYWWVDGLYSGLRGEHERLCALVVMGVNERGQKRFLAIEDGVRDSAQSWREVLR